MPGPIPGASVLLSALAVLGVVNLVGPGTWMCPYACVVHLWGDPAVWFVWTVGTVAAVFAAVGTWHAARRRPVLSGRRRHGARSRRYLATVPNVFVRRLLNVGDFGLAGIGLVP
jgi:hypothetical protein